MQAASLQANRGRTLEDLVCQANMVYFQQGRGVIHKVPTAWVPIRGKNGGVVSAKVEQKAAVDFLGVFDGLVVAFDAKEVRRGDRFHLGRVEEHQYDFLTRFADAGGYSFVLIAFWEREKFFILPCPALVQKTSAWRQKTGPASVKIGDPELIETRFMDYLNFCEWR